MAGHPCKRNMITTGCVERVIEFPPLMPTRARSSTTAALIYDGGDFKKLTSEANIGYILHKNVRC